MARIRYFVNDVEEAVDFYTSKLGFEVRGRQVICEDPSGNVIELTKPIS